jgi:uncharacterized membrane protein
MATVDWLIVSAVAAGVYLIGAVAHGLKRSKVMEVVGIRAK